MDQPQPPIELSDEERKKQLAQTYDSMNKKEKDEFDSMFTEVFLQELQKEQNKHD